jgi:hypothetical protein
MRDIKSVIDKVIEKQKLDKNIMILWKLWIQNDKYIQVW